MFRKVVFLLIMVLLLTPFMTSVTFAAPEEVAIAQQDLRLKWLWTMMTTNTPIVMWARQPTRMAMAIFV